MTELFDRITIETGKCGGRPCIRGMRIRVTDILDMMAGGMTVEQILEDYSYLERENIGAVLSFASRKLDTNHH
jgi:uncharacterized protein (DUF433 family)